MAHLSYGAVSTNLHNIVFCLYIKQWLLNGLTLALHVIYIFKSLRTWLAGWQLRQAAAGEAGISIQGQAAAEEAGVGIQGQAAAEETDIEIKEQMVAEEVGFTIQEQVAVREVGDVRGDSDKIHANFTHMFNSN